MHPVRLNALRKAYPRDNCLSAISMVNFQDQGMPLGTPMIISNEPFAASIPGHILDDFELGKGLKVDPYLDPYLPSDKSKREKLSLAEIAKFAPGRVGEILVHNLAKIKVLNMFPYRGDGWDHSYFNCNPKNVIIVPTPTLFWDEGFVCEVSSIYGVMGGEDPATKIYSMLETYRYVTYCYSDFRKDKVGMAIKELKRLISSLIAKYPVFKCYSWTDYVDAYVLTDVYSITFFRLSDALTIYDSKKAKGFAVDIFAGSSQIRTIDDMPGASMLVRLIFNIDRENLFTIDGEKINRWPDKGKLEDALEYTAMFLGKNSPVQKSQQASGRNSICAEL